MKSNIHAWYIENTIQLITIKYWALVNIIYTWVEDRIIQFKLLVLDTRMAFLSFSSRRLVSFRKYSLHLTPMHSGFKHILVLLNQVLISWLLKYNTSRLKCASVTWQSGLTPEGSSGSKCRRRRCLSPRRVKPKCISCYFNVTTENTIHKFCSWSSMIFFRKLQASYLRFSGTDKKKQGTSIALKHQHCPENKAVHLHMAAFGSSLILLESKKKGSLYTIHLKC